MSIRQLALGLVLVALSLALFAAPSPGPRGRHDGELAGSATRGRRVYVEKSCVNCHAVMGSGGTIGPDLAEVGKGRSHDRLVAKMWDHLPLMVEKYSEEGLPWPSIDADEMDDLIAYLFYLNSFDKPGDFTLGREAFSQKGCSRCHAVGSARSEVGAPALDTYAASASPMKMVTAMWNHGPAMVDIQRSLGLEVPKFNGSEIADILAYLKGTAIQTGGRSDFLRPGEPDRGRLVFVDKQCIRCHAVHGSDERSGPDLADVDFGRSVTEIAGVLWNHGPLVWDELNEQGVAIAPFTVDDMTHLLAYLYFIDFYRDDGDPVAGEKLFAKRQCAGCHLADPGADSDFPSLEDLAWVAGEDGLAAALWNHGQTMIERMRAEFLPWPSISEDEMRDITRYLEQLYFEMDE